MASTPFEGYHDEFQSLFIQIQQALVDNKHKHDESIDSLFSQCDSLLKQMSVESRGIDNDDELKQELLARVKMAKSQHAALKQELQHKLASSERSSLFLGKERLYQNKDMMQRQQDFLERARATMAETEQVGNEITAELSRNRETLEHSQQQVSTFSSMTDKAASIIKTMSKRRGIKDP